MKRTELRLNYRFLPVLVSGLALLVLVDATQVWKVLLFSLGSAWLIAYLWARSLVQGLYLQREMRYGWAQVGDQLEERFTVHNNGWAAATWLEVIDHSNIAGYQNNQVTGIESRAGKSWSTKGVCTQRGVFNLGPTSLRTSDPLGIYTVLIHDPASVSLMVAPPIVPLPHIDIAPGGRSGAGRPRTNAPERSVSASNVRPYVPGDDLRLLHWRTTARHAGALCARPGRHTVRRLVDHPGPGPAGAARPGLGFRPWSAASCWLRPWLTAACARDVPLRPGSFRG